MIAKKSAGAARKLFVLQGRYQWHVQDLPRGLAYFLTSSTRRLAARPSFNRLSAMGWV